MVWGFCVYFVYMIPLETDVLRKHRFQKYSLFIHSAAPHIHLRLDSRIEPKFSDLIRKYRKDVSKLGIFIVIWFEQLP